MARTKKIVAAGDNHNATNPLDTYIQQLEQKLAFYEAQKNIEEPDTVSEVQHTEYIKVMSLLNYRLNLCTQPNGQGKVFKFDSFGQIKKILYSDLVDILEVHSNFLEAGYFYIMNPKVIRLHGLDETYSKILTKEKIEKIINAQSEECLTLYSSANKGQQEIIIQLLVEKVAENMDSVNLNIVDKISRLAKIDIYKKAEEIKEMQSLAEADKQV